jgi:L-ribulokinase
MGAALLAGSAAGLYSDVKAVADKYVSIVDKQYNPQPANLEVYKRVFAQYRKLHDAFQVYFDDFYQ